MKPVALAGLVVAILGCAAPARAHPAPFSYLDVFADGNTLSLTLVVHTFDVGHDLNLGSGEQLLEPGVLAQHDTAIRALLRDRLRIAINGRVLDGGAWGTAEPVRDRQGLKLKARYDAGVLPGMIAVEGSLFPYDPLHQTFVNIYERGTLVSQAILDPAHTRFEHVSGTPQGALAVIRRFVPAGIHHILIGPDHLLFLIGLLLLGGSLKKLLLVVTAFTAAHSLTLSLAALDIVSPPARIIEPAIALSIVYVGADNLLVSGGRDFRAWIAFAFGFIHGFGFAYVLREMKLPAGALGWSLFSFNVGVEIGQLLVVVVVASALAALRATNETVGRRLVFAGSVVVMAAGAFWFVQRVFFPGGLS